MAANQPCNAAAPLPDATSDRGDESAETARCSAFPGTKRERGIREAVVRILEETRGHEERRWGPRVPYVRPARVWFQQPQGAGPQSDSSFVVATTDVSFEGVGVLCRREIPVQHVTLQLFGFHFACQLCWSSVIGTQFYRYGLRFLDLLDAPVQG